MKATGRRSTLISNGAEDSHIVQCAKVATTTKTTVSCAHENRIRHTRIVSGRYENRLTGERMSNRQGRGKVSKALQIRGGQSAETRFKLFGEILHRVNADGGGGGFYAAHLPLFEQLPGMVEQDFLQVLIGR